jgi:hypothetical protein
MFEWDRVRAINPPYFDFLVEWQKIAFVLIFAALGVGVLLYVLYKIKVVSMKSLKDKHDHISTIEIKRFFQVHIAFAVALFFFINWLEFQTVSRDILWFFIRMFVGLAIAILHGYVARLLLRFYWPGPMHKKMRRLRYTPRINPSNGNKMKLLSEEEEDVYLDEGKQAEENVFSVDYDVWIDDATGETHIEKYDGRLSAEECDRCGFQTLKLVKEEIIKPSSETEDGELQKEFKCTYCARVKRRTIKLSKEMRDTLTASTRLVSNPLEAEEHIVAVKIDITSTHYNRLTYEFKNLKEALRSEDLKGEGHGIESIKLELYTNEDVQLKFQFQNLPEARKFMEQFNVHNVAQ